jgi:formate dehydrogenase subunit delta
MDPTTLARMANDIAAFFAAYPPEEAQREIASHLNRFWEPRMRRALFEYGASAGAELSPLVRAALPQVSLPPIG